MHLIFSITPTEKIDYKGLLRFIHNINLAPVLHYLFCRDDMDGQDYFLG